MKIQTDGFVAIGGLPNDERYPCLVCKCVPESVIADLFIPDPEDIPSSIPVQDLKTFVMLYRLCPRCAKNRPAPWKLRLLLLERLNIVTGRQ